MPKPKKNFARAQDRGATVGREANLWKIADALRGTDGKIAQGDIFHNDRFPVLKADFILADSPFNVSDWACTLLREDRGGQVPFINHARKLGRMVDRTHRELTNDDIARTANTYHAWCGEKDAGKYADVPGFCKSATPAEMGKHGHVLTPGRYVDAEKAADDGDPLEEKMPRLVATLREQQAEKREAAIAANLKELRYGG